MRIYKSETEFNKYIEYLVESKRNFLLKQTNSTKIIFFGKKRKARAMYRNRLPDKDMKNLWVFSAVKRAFYNYIINNPNYKIYDSTVPSIKKNRARLANLKEGQIFYTTDAKHCYWRFGMLLKYIPVGLYDKLTTGEFKLLRNQAMACTMSSESTSDCKKGKFAPQKVIRNEFMREIYYNIRNKAHWTIANIAKEAGTGFLKYKIDCVYYLPKHKKAIEAAFKKHNILFETTECEYIGNEQYIDFTKNDVFKL